MWPDKDVYMVETNIPKNILHIDSGLSGNSLLHGSSYSRMHQVKCVEDSLPQFLLGPFFNT